MIRIVTVKDIANLANVSLGTVSNVLNGRGNVSLEKTLLVYEAAEKLGYIVNDQAKNLRGETVARKIAAVIIPTAEDPGYIDFFNTVKKHLEEENIQVLLMVSNGSPFLEKQLILQAAQLRVCGVISIPCALKDENHYLPLLNSGCKMVSALRDVNPSAAFVGFDFNEAGLQIGKKIADEGFQRISLLMGSYYFPDFQAFEKGLRTVFDKRNISLATFYIDDVPNFYSAFELFENAQTPDAIVLTSSRMVDMVMSASSIGSLAPCPPLIALTPNDNAVSDLRYCHYFMDYAALGRAAANQLLSQLNNNESNKNVILKPSGFRYAPDYKSICIKNPERLRILLPKAPYSDALKRMVPSFTKQSGIEIDTVEISPAKMFSAASENAKKGTADIIHSTMSTLSLHDPALFYSFENALFSELTSGMFERVVNDFSRIDGQLKAIPFDIGSELLVYRKDLFEEPLLKRMYLEAYGQELVPPNSLEDICQICSFFNKSNNSYSPVLKGTSFAVDSAVEMASGFIIRYLCYTNNKNYQRKKTTVDIQAVVAAVQNMAAISKDALIVKNNNWIGATLGRFAHGDTALEIIYLNYASDITQLKKYTYGGRIGYMQFPGNHTYVTGGSLLIPENSKQINAATKFLHWITGAEQAELFTLLGGTSPYASTYKSNDVLSQYPWYKDMEKTINSGVSRNIWDTFNAGRLDSLSHPVLKKLVENKIDVSEASSRMFSIMNEILL